MIALIILFRVCKSGKEKNYVYLKSKTIMALDAASDLTVQENSYLAKVVGYVPDEIVVSVMTKVRKPQVNLARF